MGCPSLPPPRGVATPETPANDMFPETPWWGPPAGDDEPPSVEDLPGGRGRRLLSRSGGPSWPRGAAWEHRDTASVRPPPSPRRRALPGARAPRTLALLLALAVVAGVTGLVVVSLTTQVTTGHRPHPPHHGGATVAAGGPRLQIVGPGSRSTAGSGGLDGYAGATPDGFIGPELAYSGSKVWMVTNLSLYSSSDGGRAWSLALGPTAPASMGEPLNVGFWGPAGGWLTTLGPEGVEQLYTTSDAGSHWREVDAPYGLVWVEFVGPLHAWALDARAGLFRTSDGARSWQAVRTPGPFNTVCAAGAGHVVGVVEQPGNDVYDTVDGGRHWSLAYRLPGPVFSGSTVAVCSPASPRAVVAYARALTAASDAEAVAMSAPSGPWSYEGSEPGTKGVAVALSPGGGALVAYQQDAGIIVYRAGAGPGLPRVAEIPTAGEPPGGTVQAGVGASGRGLVALTCGTTVYEGATRDGGATWAPAGGRLTSPGRSTDSSC
jgi:photosystem II stability/assembly factor-like uncharacterized protein